MFDKKTKFLFIALFLLIIVLVIVEVFAPKTQEQTTTQASPAPQFTNQIPFPSASTNLIPFTLVARPNIDGKLGVVDKLSFSFSSPIASQEIKYLITPPIEMTAKVESNGTVLTLEPTQTWDFATKYTLTVYRSLISLDGQTLSEDINLDFETVPYSGF